MYVIFKLKEREDTMNNILETKQYSQAEKADILLKAYWKREFDLVLFYHYQVTSEELLQKEVK
jgi:hypothetical protein